MCVCGGAQIIALADYKLCVCVCVTQLYIIFIYNTTGLWKMGGGGGTTPHLKSAGNVLRPSIPPLCLLHLNL